MHVLRAVAEIGGWDQWEEGGGGGKAKNSPLLCLVSPARLLALVVRGRAELFGMPSNAYKLITLVNHQCSFIR